MSHSDSEIESRDVEIETLEVNYSNSKDSFAEFQFPRNLRNGYKWFL